MNEKIEDLIEEARRAAPGDDATELAVMVHRLTDALEAATRERDAALEAIDRVRAAVEKHEHWNDDCGWDVPTIEVLAALDGAPDGAPEPELEPCTAEIHSWSKQAFHQNQDIDLYWIRCTLLGKHDEHEDSNTGLTWRSGLPVEGEKR